MEYQNLRISKLRNYLMNVIDELNGDTNSKINADMLSDKINDYSLDKIPTDTESEKWVIGVVKKHEIFSFRSRKLYSQDTINNLKNIGFFEKFEDKIKSNNDKGILPDIKNIEEIKCLNCGTMNYADSDTAEFDIQIQITYREEVQDEITSL